MLIEKKEIFLRLFLIFIFLGTLSSQLSFGDHGYSRRHLCVINAFHSSQVHITLSPILKVKGRP